MTEYDLQLVDTLETSEYITGELSDDDLDIPAHMVPPNPEDADILPSQSHPSYPYGNPNSSKHPSSRPRLPKDLTSRALYQDGGSQRSDMNAALLWKDLAMDILLPVDEEKEAERRAATARKMASGAAANHQTHAQQHQQPADQTLEEEDEGDEDDDEENDENGNEEEDDEDEEGSFEE
ncbi:hypothetical protein PLICRDRAFT_177048 [Plicaturopsis crispa FD-325 SS-3]|nr:hypothetical protein PLICRDRAFT_177048 [Plicaturopsis crispa FD-325 SS-3]